MPSDQDQADIEACEGALGALLTAIINHPPPASQRPLQATPFVWRDPSAIPRRGSVNLEALTRDPVGTACRAEIRRVGIELHRLGGTGRMRLTAEAVADRDPAKAGRRVAIMDAAWNGIGEGNDRWRS